MSKGKIEVLRQNDKGAWSAKIVDGDTETWYGLGFSQPSVAKGDVIEFEAKQNGKFWNIDTKSIRKVEAEVQQNKPVAEVAKGGASNKEEYWSKREAAEEHKQKQINWQSARYAAIQLLPTLFEQGAVKLPTKKADQYDAVLSLVDEITVKFYTDTADPEAKLPENEADEPVTFGDMDNGGAFDDDE